MTTRLDLAALDEALRAELGRYLLDPEALALTVTVDRHDDWQGALVLPTMRFEDDAPSPTEVHLAGGRVDFTLDYEGKLPRNGTVAIRIGALEGADAADGTRFSVRPFEIDYTFRDFRWYRGRVLEGRGEFVMRDLEFSGRDSEGPFGLEMRRLSFAGGTRFMRDGRAEGRLSAELRIGRLVQKGTDFGSMGGSMDFTMRFGTRRVLEYLVDLSTAVTPDAQGDFADELTDRLPDVLRDVFGRAGMLALTLAFDSERRGGMNFELSLDWPATPDGQAPATLGDWLAASSGRIFLRYPRAWLEDPELQQFAATPLASGFAAIEGDSVVGRIRLANGMLISGGEMQPLTVLLGSAADIPLNWSAEGEGGAQP